MRDDHVCPPGYVDVECELFSGVVSPDTTSRYSYHKLATLKVRHAPVFAPLGTRVGRVVSSWLRIGVDDTPRMTY